VADSALTVGVVLLFFVFPHEEREEGPDATSTPGGGAPPG